MLASQTATPTQQQQKNAKIWPTTVAQITSQTDSSPRCVVCEATLRLKQEWAVSEAGTRRPTAPVATAGWHWMMLVVWQPWAVAAVAGINISNSPGVCVAKVSCRASCCSLSQSFQPSGSTVFKSKSRWLKFQACNCADRLSWFPPTERLLRASLRRHCGKCSHTARTLRGSEHSKKKKKVVT